jgi:hypothetical protein
MITDWKELAKQIGSLRDDRESGGDEFAQIAFEQILGQEWIESTVDDIVFFKRGSELAMNCLRYIRSKQAILYAYSIYKSSSGERASRAVWLIKQIAHPISLDWVEDFLNDDNVMGWGIGVLDKLLWEEQIPFDAKIERLLKLADGKEQLKEQVDFIRQYIEERNQNSR